MKILYSKKVIIPIVILFFCIFISLIFFYNNQNDLPLTELFKNEQYELIVENYKKNKYSETTNWKETILIARSAFYIEDYELSKEVYDNILSDKFINDLERANILYYYSMTLVKLKDVDGAFNTLQEGIEECAADLTMSRKLKRSYGLLVKSFPREYNIENGLNYLKDSIDLDITGADYEVRFAYALLLYYGEEYEEALKYNKEVLRIKFDYLPAEKLMPKIYFENGNVEDAIFYLNQLNVKYPTDIDNRLYLAQIFELIENYNNAEKTYNETIMLDKKNIEAHIGLIRCYISQDKINPLLNEIKIFRKTFPEDNKYSEIINNLEEKYMPKLITDKKELDELNIE